MLRSPVVGLLMVVVVALGGVACNENDSPPGRREMAPAGELGAVVYVDGGGCIARVSIAQPAESTAVYCPESKAGVAAVTWLDANIVSFTTPETRAVGWRMYDFTTGTDKPLPADEAPRVLFTASPEYHSVRDEHLEIDGSGTIYRWEGDDRVAIFTPAAKDPATRLLTWSPDGEWVLFTQSGTQEIWAVRRDGTGLRKLAENSRGVASWFMPGVGAMPHADLTCSLPTTSTWNCMVDLRSPAQGAVLDPGASRGQLNISWSACPGVTGYELQILSPDSDNPIITYFAAGTAYHGGLAALPISVPGELRWRVRSLIGTQQGPWSEVRTFLLKPGGRALDP